MLISHSTVQNIAKKLLKIFFWPGVVVFSLASFTTPAQGQTIYYVDGANGNDSTNTCTAADDACQSINAALAKVVAGDTVKIAPWNNPYQESIIVPVNDLTIEGTGQKASDVVINQGISNTVDNVTIRNLFINNDQNRAVLNGGNLTLEKVRITGHSPYCGGAISTQKAVRPRGVPLTDATTLILKDSTITGSTTEDNGGGICARSYSTVKIINSTLSGNQAVGSSDPNFAPLTGMGGAIYVYGGGVFLYNSTITDNVAANQGGALSVLSGMGYNLEIYNSILANNTTNGLNENCDVNNIINNGAYNLENDTSCDDPNKAGIFTVNGDPLLDSLQDNGGATLTHALLDGSPAIDAGDPNGCKGPNGILLDTDQTGHQRVGRCDIGSFEYVPAGWQPPNPTPTPTPTPTATVLTDPSSPPQGSSGNTLPPATTNSGGTTQLTNGATADSSAAGGCSLNAGSTAQDYFWLLGTVLLGLPFFFFRKGIRPGN